MEIKILKQYSEFIDIVANNSTCHFVGTSNVK